VQNVQTLIQQNVDCILISISTETARFEHLQEVMDHGIALIQLDRVNESIQCDTVVNDNKQAAYRAAKHLIKQGYSRIAFLGGPDHIALYRDRKAGYLKAMEEAGLHVPYDYVQQHVITMDAGMERATALLQSTAPPDAFFTISDMTALGVLNAAKSLGLSVPQEVGIVGFANEKFTELVTPTITSVNQNSRVLGKEAANIYFRGLRDERSVSGKKKPAQHVVKTSLAIRDSSAGPSR
jgi:LacI family transcriptional regulator